MFDVKGRPKRSWNIKIVPGEGCLLIRLDDDDDDEFWQEIRIPESDLLRWGKIVFRKTHAPELPDIPLPELPALAELPELPELPDLGQLDGR